MGKHLAPRPAPAPASGEAIPVHRHLSKLAIALLFVLAVVVGLGTALGVRSVQSKQSPVEVVTRIFIPSPEAKFGKDRILVLIAGLDYDYDTKDMPTSKNSRTDTIKVAALDFPTRMVKLVSVPRDMDYEVNGVAHKINEAYTIGGVRKSEQWIGSFLGLPNNEAGVPFDKYVIVRINALKDFVDAIGGVDMKVEKKMDYDDTWGHLHIHLKPGYQHLTGDQAVGYARFRHDEEGDIGRIRRQDQVIQAVIAKLKRDKFNDVVHIRDLIGVMNRDVMTNLTFDEELSLANHYSSFDPKSLKSAQIPYTDAKDTASAGNVLIPDESGKTKIVAEMLTGPFATPPPSVPVNVAAIAPASVHVEVLNGSGEKGAAQRVAAGLQKKGFVVDAVGNADAYTYPATELRVHTATPGVGEKVKAELAVPTAVVSPDPQLSVVLPDAPNSPGSGTTAKVHPIDVTVVVGKDAVGALKAASAGTVK